MANLEFTGMVLQVAVNVEPAAETRLEFFEIVLSSPLSQILMS